MKRRLEGLLERRCSWGFSGGMGSQLVGRLIAIGLVAVFLAIPALGQAQTTVSVFDVDTGVRPLGMGGAFAGLADDENSLFYNPAGLAFSDRLRLGSFYEPRFGGSYGDLALAGRGLGGGVLFFSLGGITQYDTQDRPGAALSYGSYGLIGSYALRPGRFFAAVPKTLALGLGAKFLQISSTEAGSGSGLALDWGLLLNLGRLAPVEDIRLGLLIRNLPGLGVTYGNGHTEPWAIGLRLGASGRVQNLTLASDLEGSGAFLLGAEYRFTGLGYGVSELVLRAGGFLRNGFAPTLGLGLGMQNFRVDYAFIAYPQAPATHRLAFSIDLTPFLQR
jgi:hypothetical protein